MTITLHWWHAPACVTAIYLLWALWPTSYRSSMWGDLEIMFGHVIGLLAVAVSWAAFAVGMLVFGGAA